MTIAIIPARGGSRRIPRKNLLPMPAPYNTVLGHAISVARQCGINDVFVSTDDEIIATEARKHGAMLVERSYELSQDEVGTQEVTAEALSKVGMFVLETDTVACIYPCTPLLAIANLQRALKQFTQMEPDNYLVSVGQYAAPIHQALEDMNGKLRYAMPQFRKWASDKLPPRYYDAGQFYIGRAQSFVDHVPLDGHMVPYFLPPWQAIDVNTPEDWELAKMVYEGGAAIRRNLA